MSQENVEIVRRFIEAARSGDAHASEAFVAVSDPSIEHARLPAASGPETYCGHDGVRSWFTDMADLWREWRNEIEELVEVGPDTVAARIRFVAVGRESGVPVEARLGLVCVLSEGKVLRTRTYASGEEAVGLSEQPPNMTSEAVSVVRAFVDLAAAEDYAGMREHIHPDAVWYGTRGGLDEGQVLRGPDAWVEYMREIRTPWQRMDVEVERVIDLGDRVVVLLHESARARRGELEVENDTAAIFTVRGEKLVEVRGYLDRDEALRSAGLAE